MSIREWAMDADMYEDYYNDDGPPADGCELCGEMVNYLKWTQDHQYLVCEVCWSEYPSGRLTTDH